MVRILHLQIKTKRAGIAPALCLLNVLCGHSPLYGLPTYGNAVPAKMAVKPG